MNLNNEVVRHKKFGVGTIIESESDYIVVLFHDTKEQKKFIYPDSIGGFLELQNKSYSENKELLSKDAETGDECKNEQSRIKNIKGIIKRENSIKKIMGIRKESEKK